MRLFVDIYAGVLLVVLSLKDGKVVVTLAFFSAGKPYCQYKNSTTRIEGT